LAKLKKRTIERIVKEIAKEGIDIGSNTIRLRPTYIDMEGGRIINLGAPIDSTDALRKYELDLHKTATVIDHPDRSITRAKLEYPTVDVSFAFLAVIDKVVPMEANDATPISPLVRTVDQFTDKGMITATGGSVRASGPIHARIQSGGSYYVLCYMDTGHVTADFRIEKFVNNALTNLAYEAVDLNDHCASYVNGSVSGSTLKAYRLDMNTPKLTVTDTAFASGYFGHGAGHYYDAGDNSYYAARLIAPSSPSLPALVIVEVNSSGSGMHNDPFIVELSENKVEINALSGLPEFLYREAKRYEILRRKFTDEEIEAIFGPIQHQVDLNAVTWGAFEFSNESPTNIIAIYGDNPYKPGAISRQIEHARSRNLKVISPPRDYREAVEQFRMLSREFPHWLAGKDNYAYQTLGHEVFEIFQNIDFYYGEFLEHKEHYNQIKQVPDFEIQRRLDELESKLSKIDVLIDERDKHHDKLREIIRRGW